MVEAEGGRKNLAASGLLSAVANVVVIFDDGEEEDDQIFCSSSEIQF